MKNAKVIVENKVAHFLWLAMYKVILIMSFKMCLI